MECLAHTLLEMTDHLGYEHNDARTKNTTLNPYNSCTLLKELGVDRIS